MSEENNANTENTAQIDMADPAVQAAIKAAVDAATAPLIKKRDELLSETKTAKDKARAYEAAGLTPEEIADIKAAREKAEQEEAQKQGNWQKVIEDRDRKAAAEKEKITKELTARAEKAEAFAISVVKENAVTSALVAVNVEPRMVRGAKSLLGDMVRVVEDGDGGWKAVATVNGEEMEVAAAAKLWAESEEGQFYVAAPANSGGGGGVRGAGSKATANNPWKTGNITEQMRVYTENPALAQQMMRDAGK